MVKKINLEENTKKMYNNFGEEYQKKRYYNEYVEIPNMLKAVKNIKGKNLLDIGCGAGIHIKAYSKKGAKCSGIDISETMIEMAKKNNPKVEFKVGTVTKLPYKSNSFDVVTCSLILDYIADLNLAYKEINRILKKGGILYYSYNSPVACVREDYEDNNYKIRGVGKFIDKKRNKTIFLGQNGRLENVEWLPGMNIKCYWYPIHIHLRALIKNHLELIDLVDCYPIKSFKNRYPEKYAHHSKYPLWTIYVCRKK
ncbi:MAG TPA: class I SAM-dependent methyltransferase [archaeon]|nr:class I SAM-dependent methyltransferase [archaeon]